MNSEEMMRSQSNTNNYIRNLLNSHEFMGSGYKNWLKHNELINAMYEEFLKKTKFKNSSKNFKAFLSLSGEDDLKRYEAEKDKVYYTKPCNEYKTAYKQYLCNGGTPEDYMVKGDKNRCLKFMKTKYDQNPDGFSEYIKNLDFSKKPEKPVEPELPTEPAKIEDVVKKINEEKEKIKEEKKKIREEKKRLKKEHDDYLNEMYNLYIEKFGKKPTAKKLAKFMKTGKGGCMDCNGTCGGYLYDTPYNSENDEMEQKNLIDSYMNRNMINIGYGFDNSDDMDYYDLYGEGVNKKAKAYKKFLEDKELDNSTKNWKKFLEQHTPMKRKKKAKTTDESTKKSKKAKKSGEVPKQLKPWLKFMKKFMKEHEDSDKTYKEKMAMAKKKYKKEKE